MKRKRVNKSDRLLEYSCKPTSWAKDHDGKMWDRMMRLKATQLREEGQSVAGALILDIVLSTLKWNNMLA